MKSTAGVRLPIALSIGFLLIAAATPARAEEAPPTRVGRVSYVAGSTNLQSGNEAMAAAVNLPVAERQSLRTDAPGRAELRLGALSIMLSGATQLDIARLDDAVTQLAVPHGRIALDLRRLDSGSTVEINTPRGGVWLLEPGRYDIDSGAPGQAARVTAFVGSARFVGGQADRTVAAGEALSLAGADPLAATAAAPPRDAFLEWCRTREVDEAQLTAPLHLSRDVTGYEELDANGSWQVDPDYGAVWVPNAAPSEWAPYRDGRWARIAPWGWTWIDDQPWAFAPSHYGRWARLGGSGSDDGAHWAWVPGKFVDHPAYLPAAVGFLGTDGVGLSYAAAFGPAIAWFPLGPGEIYWPRFSHDPAVIRRLNAGAVADLAAIGAAPDAEAPAEIPGGHFANRAFAVSIPRAVFLAGKPVASARLDVPPQRLLLAPLLLGSLPQPGPVAAVLRGPAVQAQPGSAAAIRVAVMRALLQRPVRFAAQPPAAARRRAGGVPAHGIPHRMHFAAGRAAFR